MGIILASKSPQRKKILNLMNINFTIKESNINEDSFKKNHQNPKKYCENLAYEKANNISKDYKNSLVIGADTIVYHKNKIMGKPKNKQEAFSHLKSNLRIFSTSLACSPKPNFLRIRPLHFDLRIFKFQMRLYLTCCDKTVY